ncbi:MAG: 2-succinyl-5-enolpyruvyl-6-hydroxy-3-cyclohexene-1-carboxylate synthase, partial [Bacteroidaceae bacterium]|nr:2-succinyl-5-enolpyruvyl-6-hydroxy-3-cyclohexene-1-carboxylate synthase [Bacteroidaceae bacterium]
MLSSDRNILELLALLDAHGIRELVLCPGSRNAGIVHSALNCGKFNCHPLTDERSAGFYAIGLTQATGKPSAVIVTSGSALANLYPAACEAYYQEIPVIFISADRPAEWIGQMD